MYMHIYIYIHVYIYIYVYIYTHSVEAILESSWGGLGSSGDLLVMGWAFGCEDHFCMFLKMILVSEFKI